MRTSLVAGAGALALTLVAATAGAAAGPSPIAQSKAAFAQYSKLPAPLKIPAVGKPIPTGKVVAAVGAMGGNPQEQEGLKEAAAALGWTVKFTFPPTTPDAYGSALQSVLAQKPDAVIFWTPFPATAFDAQLQAFKSAGIPVVTKGGIGYPVGGSSPVIADGGGRNAFVPLAKLEADTAVAFTGKSPNVALAIDPSIPAWKPIIDGFKSQMKLLGASYNELDVAFADIGKDAPTKIVSYLQAHPSINYVVLTIPLFGAGVQQALATAGLAGKIKFIAGAAIGTDVPNVANGTYLAAVALEEKTGAWREMDALARYFAGAKIVQPHIPTTYLIVTKKNLKLAENLDGFPNQNNVFLKAWGKK